MIDSTHPPRTRLLGIAGSLRAGSYNQTLLRHAGTLLPADVELVTWDDLGALPPFSEDTEDTPATSVLSLREAIDAAHGVLVVSPEYNGSVPGPLKNALDWASRPFPANVLRGKAAAVIGASPSPSGAARAQREVRTVLARIGAAVIPGGLAVPDAYRAFDEAGGLVDPDLDHQLSDVLAELIHATMATPAGVG